MPCEKKQRSTSSRAEPYPVRTSSRIRAARNASEQPEKKHSNEAKEVKKVDDEDVDEEIYRDSLQVRVASSGALQPYRALPSPDDDDDDDKTEVTAGEIALQTYGVGIKIDSVLCKKLSVEPALREVKQRRPEMGLNMTRRSNVEAFLGQLTGVSVVRPCKNCNKGHGPWNECIIYDGQMCGSCTNCWFNASGSRCTFHESNQTSIYEPTPRYNPRSAGNPTQHQQIEQAPIATTLNLPPSTTNMINAVVADAVNMSQRERIMARVEDSARQLGMHIAELREYAEAVAVETEAASEGSDAAESEVD
ncbi:hypothetical protein DER45DRAFT_608392 [Fusarium avenaceum]|nr:hypothetical protein DER45DRAFT_608392 [Fusarium avenaceum]